jgi:hypothetical protein
MQMKLSRTEVTLYHCNRLSTVILQGPNFMLSLGSTVKSASPQPLSTHLGRASSQEPVGHRSRRASAYTKDCGRILGFRYQSRCGKHGEATLAFLFDDETNR